MVKFLWRCDGNGLFFQSDAVLSILDTVTNVIIATDYLDFTIVDDVLFFFTFLLVFMIFPGIFMVFHGF